MSPNATEKDFASSLDQTSVASGDVTFHITNEGSSTHEFVVFKTDLAPDKLPTKNGVVNAHAKQLDHVDENRRSIQERRWICPSRSIRALTYVRTRMTRAAARRNE